MHSYRTILAIFMLSASCARPGSGESEVDSSSAGDIPDLPRPDETSGGDESPCEPGLTRCDGICVDLQLDGDNCGTCGFSCHEGYYFEGSPYCMFGECTPSIQGCVREEAGLTTCTEFCASIGESCRDSDDELDCVIAVSLTASTSPEDCWGSPTFETLLDCDDPIPYGLVEDQFTYDVAHCCCTHTPQ